MCDNKMCYVCFNEDELVQCTRCVYSICKPCILNEKMSRAISDGVCIRFTYTCGVCRAHSIISKYELTNAIIRKTIDSPLRVWEKYVAIIDLNMIFFTIHDLDTDDFEVIEAWDD